MHTNHTNHTIKMDIKKLLTRAISGLVYCLIIVGCTLWGTDGVFILSVLLSTLSCVEFSRVCHEFSRRTLPVLIIDIAGCIFLSLGYMLYPLIGWISLMMARLIEQLYINSDHPLRDLAHSFMSQIYIGLPLGLMTAMAWILSPKIILVIFILIWINDTGAFLVGTLIGRHRLFERISPKKSWEGFIGGLLFCLGASVLFYYYGNSFFRMDLLEANLAVWLGLGAVVCVFGTWGDLVESMIKRTLKIKDSGNLIPGHGGILDRIDSLLLAVPATAVYFSLLIICK